MSSNTLKQSTKGVLFGLTFLIAVLGAELTGIKVPNSAAVLLLLVVFSSFRYGLLPALINSLMAWVAIAASYSQAQHLTLSDHNGLVQMLSWAALLLFGASFHWLLQRKIDGNQQPPSEPMNRNTLEVLLETLEIGVWTWDAHTNKLEWDEGMCRLYGLEPGWCGTYEQWWENMLHPDDRPSILQELTDATREKRTFKKRFRIRTPSGSIRYVESRSRHTLSELGSVSKIVGVNWDATAAALADEQLTIQKNLTEAILENIPICVFAKDIKDNFKFTIWNKASEELLEVAKAKVIGKSAHDLWSKDHADLYLESDKRVAQTGQLLDIPEEPYLTHSRGITTMHTIKFPLKIGAQLESRYVISISEDISQRKLTEQALMDSERQFRTMFEAAPLGIAVISSTSGHIQRANPRFSAITGRSIETLQQSRWQDITYPDDIQGDLDLMAKLNAGEIKSFKMTKRYLKPNGQIVWIDMAISPLNSERSTQKLHLCMIEDINERKHVEAELKKAKEAAEESTQIKSTFLANMSHEIRTPLTVIRGFAELLSKNHGNQEQGMMWISNILRSSQQLELLLSDILDLAKVESGKIHIERIKTPLAKIINEVRDILALTAAEKGIALHFSFMGQTPEFLESDPARLKQVLINVIHNAIKFTPKGRVDVHISLEEGAQAPRKLIIEVQDTGIGISAEQREKIFDMFTQADGSITRRFGGTGLGLALARHLARLLGGDLVLLNSELNRGTSFAISVDTGPISSMEKLVDFDAATAQICAIEVAPPADAVELEGFSILLVEDAPDLRTLLSFILHAQGATVATATNGLEGIEMVHRGVYDVILMDIQMPVLGGLEATEQLRAEGLKFLLSL